MICPAMNFCPGNDAKVVIESGLRWVVESFVRLEDGTNQGDGKRVASIFRREGARLGRAWVEVGNKVFRLHFVDVQYIPTTERLCHFIKL